MVVFLVFFFRVGFVEGRVYMFNVEWCVVYVGVSFGNIVLGGGRGVELVGFRRVLGKFIWE